METKISKIVAKMIEGKEALAVFDDDFVGIISSNEIIDRDYPMETKARHLVKKNLPKIEEKTGISEAAKIFLDNNIKAAPVFSGKNIIGLIYEKDLVRSLDCLENKTTEDISTVPEIIEMNDNIGKARSILKEKNVSRLPVVDENGKLAGILDIVDFLKTVNPKESVGRKDSKGDVVPEYKLSVTTIMNSSPICVEGNIPCKDVVEIFKKRDCSYVIITREKEPMGIVTSKDILEMMASYEKGDGVYIQITGLNQVEDSFDREKVDSIIEEYARKIGKIYEGIEYFFIHIKSSRKEGEKSLYSIRARVSTSAGLYVSRSSGWNLVTAVEEAMERLERQVVQEHQKMVENKKA